MPVNRELLDPALALLAGLGLLSSVALILTVPRTHVSRPPGVSDRRLIVGLIALAALGAFAITGNALGALVSAGAMMVLCELVRRALPRLSAVGAVQTALAPAALLCVTPWSYLLLREQGFPDWVLVSLGAGAALGLGTFAFGFATRLVDDAVLTHAEWSRATRARPERIGSDAPKVSIHVPCYAEPPEIVMATLQRLAELRYSNYEVIVCDNNTPDEALWRPVQRFCAQLTAAGRAPFHFHHVSPLAGAKAGALNYVLQHTAKDAELVAVIDADYLAEPDFLARLTGFFDDPNVGFVQTPHDYRRDGSAYQSMCYWEYMPPNKVGLASLNEYDCAYTIGTMCILRKDAIEAAGGWAEWCLTEDSEILIRIRALGYEGVYVNETFGRGLIPETYEDYKKQRFRWTAGPVQQLLTHWRLFLPTALGGSPALHGWVKLLEAHRSVAPLLGVFQAALGVAASALMFWLTVEGRLPQIQLPAVFWIATALAVASGLARRWQQYRLTGLIAPHAIVGAELARVSLAYVKAVAALAPLSGRPIQWWRTPKFAARNSAARALFATTPELALAMVLALLAFVPVRRVADLGDHAALLGTVGLAGASLAFLAAPVMALLGEARLRRLTPAAAVDAEPIAEPSLSRAA